MKNFYLLSLFIFLSIKFEFTNSCSCSPESKLNLQKEFNEAYAIFSGIIINRFNTTNQYTKQYEVNITKIWKGNFINKSNSINITSSSEESLCGINYKNDIEYLIWTNSKPDELNRLSTNHCSRTQELTYLSGEIKSLLENSKNISLLENSQSILSFNSLLVFFAVLFIF